MASSLKQQANLAKNRAQELLDFNNSASSNTSDKLFSILEAGEGSSIGRDQLDQGLHNFLENTVNDPNRVTALGYERAKLRQCLSIKEKIAYITGLIYADEGAQSHTTPLDSKENIVDQRIRNRLTEVITNLEEHLINNRDFTESRILRNAAINRFQCELSVSESNELNSIGGRMKDVCVNNGLDTLAESTHFTNESDAQKIMKLGDVMRQISASGIKIDEHAFKDFEKFDKRIEPLRTLDKHYEHVTKTLNMLHRVAQKGYHAIITPKQKGKLEGVLQKTEMTKTVNDELNKFNTLENFNKNEEHGFLENLLKKIKEAPKYKETLYSMSISDAEFNEWFISSSAFTLMERARLGLATQKGVAFGAKMKDFEADTQSRRGMVRRRIFDIADRMGDGADFHSPQDFETANSYFNKFKDLFFAKEEDNYRTSPNADATFHYHKMEKVVSALVRRRVPALASTNRIRRGSAGRILKKFIENALKGKERGMYQRMRTRRHRADDATIVAMVIMAQNEATNQVFYQDQDKSKKADSFRGKLWNKISFTENGRMAIRDRVGPIANKALTFVEEAAIRGAKLTAGLAKVTNKVVSKGTRGVTRVGGKLTEKYNGMIEEGGYKRWKTPLYLPYLLSKPGEKVFKLTNQGATYTDLNGNAGIDVVKKVTNEGYESAKDLVAKGTGEETKYLFQGLTRITEGVTSFAGKTVSAGGQRVYDSYSVGQQRGILGAFYAAAKEQKGLEDLMQSTDLAEMLNLKERGPYLFDKDGRITITENVEKKAEDSPEGAGKKIADKLKEQLDLLIQQANDEVNEKIAIEKKANEGTDEKAQEKAANNLTHAKNIKNNVNNLESDLRNLVPILKKPMTNGTPPTWRNGEIQTIRTTIDTTLKQAATGLITKLTQRIGLDGVPATIITAAVRPRPGIAAGPGGVPPAVAPILAAPAVIGTPATRTGLTGDLAQARLDIAILTGCVKSDREIMNKASTRVTACGRDVAARATEQAALDDAINALKTSEEELARAEAARSVALYELKNARDELGWLEKIDGMMRRIADISTRMNAAVAAGTDTKSIAGELLQMSKNMDIILHPIAKKEGEINVDTLTDEAAKKLLENLNKKLAPVA